MVNCVTWQMWILGSPVIIPYLKKAAGGAPAGLESVGAISKTFRWCETWSPLWFVCLPAEDSRKQGPDSRVCKELHSTNEQREFGKWLWIPHRKVAKETKEVATTCMDSRTTEVVRGKERKGSFITHYFVRSCLIGTEKLLLQAPR